MIGYVFLTSGAIRTSTPQRYPSRQDQIDNIRFAADAIGLSPDEVSFVFEKVPRVHGLDSLPKLRHYLVRAAKTGQSFFIDDLRRVFYACPIDKRRELLRELAPYLELIHEISREGELAASRNDAGLRALVNVDRPVRYRAEPKERPQRSATTRKKQTARARRVSARSRKAQADRKAAQLQALKAKMLETREQVTNKALAEEANERGLKTTRGNEWSQATVKRTLDRLKRAEEEPR